MSDPQIKEAVTNQIMVFTKIYLVDQDGLEVAKLSFFKSIRFVVEMGKPEISLANLDRILTVNCFNELGV